MFTIDLNDELGKKVVSLEVVRRSVMLRGKGLCAHLQVEVDTTLAQIRCRDCNKDLNAIEWIANIAEYWQYVQRLTDQQREAAETLDTKIAALDMKARCRCEHCNRITRIPVPSPSQAKLLLAKSDDGDPPK